MPVEERSASIAWPGRRAGELAAWQAADMGDGGGDWVWHTELASSLQVLKEAQAYALTLSAFVDSFCSDGL